MKAKGIIPHYKYNPRGSDTRSGLSGNNGFTLPANIGELGDITDLNLADCSLTGPLSTRSERFIFAAEIDVCACPLPKVLPSSLETLQFGPDDPCASNSNKFEGGIPAEWAGLTNLKKNQCREMRPRR